MKTRVGGMAAIAGGLLLSTLSLAQATGTAAARPAAVDGARLTAADREPGNWMSTGRTYGEQRYSPLEQVNDKTVGKLGLAWRYPFGLDRVIEATPIVVDGVMYTTSAYSIVHALDARTGKLLWKYDPEVYRGIQASGCCDAANRGVAVWNGKVYVGVYDGRLEALDARTGKRVWSVNTVIDADRNYTITGAPRIVKGKVVIGNGGGEYGVRGYVTAYDADTGAQAWRFFTVPGDPAKGDESDTIAMIRKTWAGDQYWKQGGGGTVWDAMAYDPELDLLYIGVGNGSYWHYGQRSEGKGDNLFLSSVVALRPDTGRYVWHYQTTPGDAWDFTATQHIIVATLPIDGQPRKVVMQAPKNGFFYVLDAATGRLISAEKFVPMVNWAKSVDPATGRPVIDAEAADYWTEGKPKLVFPGSLGAHNWQPMSFSPKTGLVYIPAQSTADIHHPKSRIDAPRKGVWSTGMEIPSVPEDKKSIDEFAAIYTGKLLAWDPVRQKEAWSAPYAQIANGGTLATAGNLVFQGSHDGRLLAYAADSGKLLWERRVSSGVVAAPVTYTVDGEQYVTFSSGWGGSYPIAVGPLSERTRGVPDAQVFTFKLGGSAAMPKVRQRALVPPDPPPATADAATVNAGRELYRNHCGMCHGLGAFSANVIPDLREMSPQTHEDFQAIVAGARAMKGMPPFGAQLKPAEVEQIRAYLIQRAHDRRTELR